MTDTPCVRTFVHSCHETDQGWCPGVSVLQRTQQLGQMIDTLQHTECPHAGCAHDAATPDAAHCLDPDLVASLQALAAHHGPQGLYDAMGALWPDTADAQPVYDVSPRERRGECVPCAVAHSDAGCADAGCTHNCQAWVDSRG